LVTSLFLLVVVYVWTAENKTSRSLENVRAQGLEDLLNTDFGETIDADGKGHYVLLSKGVAKAYREFIKEQESVPSSDTPGHESRQGDREISPTDVELALIQAQKLLSTCLRQGDRLPLGIDSVVFELARTIRSIRGSLPQEGYRNSLRYRRLVLDGRRWSFSKVCARSGIDWWSVAALLRPRPTSGSRARRITVELRGRYRVKSTPVLGGLHNEYRLEKEAA